MTLEPLRKRRYPASRASFLSSFDRIREYVELESFSDAEDKMLRSGSISSALLNPNTRSGLISCTSSSLKRSAAGSPIQPSVLRITTSDDRVRCSFSLTTNFISLSGPNEGLVSPTKNEVSDSSSPNDKKG